jgi:hypothetical protein
MDNEKMYNEAKKLILENTYESRDKAYSVMKDMSNKDMQLLVMYFAGRCL